MSLLNRRSMMTTMDKNYYVESVTEYIHPEDWITDELGNAWNFACAYCNAEDTTDRNLYVCYVRNNEAPENYNANYMLFQRYSDTAFAAVNYRKNWQDASARAADNRSFYITAGATVVVVKMKFGE